MDLQKRYSRCYLTHSQWQKRVTAIRCIVMKGLIFFLGCLYVTLVLTLDYRYHHGRFSFFLPFWAEFLTQILFSACVALNARNWPYCIFRCIQIVRNFFIFIFIVQFSSIEVTCVRINSVHFAFVCWKEYYPSSYVFVNVFLFIVKISS